MESYYKEILHTIRTHISEQNYEKAFRLLEDELAMPYIPKQSEQELIELYNECRSELRAQKGQRSYQEADLEALLYGDMDEALMAVELLKNSNLRQHLDLIAQYLNRECPVLIRALLIDAMMEQDIQVEMHTQINGMEVSFLPNYIEPVMQAEGAVLAANTLCEWFEHEDPNFLTMCMESLIQECYLHLPFNIALDEGLPLAIAIVHYVKKAQDDMAGFEQFVKQHHLEQENGMVLYLAQYKI